MTIKSEILSHSQSKDLKTKGWTVLEVARSKCLVEAGKAFGEPIPSRRAGKLVDTLIPRDVIDAHPNSLSAVYGKGCFPFHTDGAYFKIPPRYILMRSISEFAVRRPTLILGKDQLLFSTIEQKILEYDVWYTSNRINGFYCSIINRDLTSEPIFRFDGGCMRPATGKNTRSQEILSQMLTVTPQEIHWKPSMCLLIDNWVCLHARGPAPVGIEEARVLERVLVREKQDLVGL